MCGKRQSGISETLVKARICEEMTYDVETLISRELNDKNLMKAIN